jgi:hypothetical protein
VLRIQHQNREQNGTVIEKYDEISAQYAIVMDGQWQRNFLDQSAPVEQCVAPIENAVRYENPHDPAHGKMGNKIERVLIEDFAVK